MPIKRRSVQPVSSSSPRSASQAIAAWPRHVERHADLGALGALPNGARVGAVAEREAERVDEDRLAGAGLAGHDVEAAAELDLDLVDDGVVLDADQAQHGPLAAEAGAIAARAPQLSFERSSS